MTTDDIILAAGCFWGVEELFRNQPGVLSTEVGYTGGTLLNPTYEDVKTGTTDHAEAIKITYDKDKTSLSALLHFFFSMHDPTTLNRQGNDRGTQYRSTIFVGSEEEKTVARQVLKSVEDSGVWQRPLTTTLQPRSPFYSAETEHQNYLQKHPGGYTCHWQRYTPPSDDPLS